MNSTGYVALMNVHVNGQLHTFTDVDDLSVAQLLERLSVIPRSGVAVAVNFAVVPKSRWEIEHVAEGDEIEIVRATQGG